MWSGLPALELARPQGQLLRLLGQLDDAVAERPQVRIVAGAGDRALVVALHEDDRLPDGERHVPAHGAHRAAGALLVAGDEFGPRREALLARHLAEVLPQSRGRVVGLRPERAEVAEVGERVA